MGDSPIVEGGLDLGDNVGRVAGRDTRGVFAEVREVRREGRALAVLPGYGDTLLEECRRNP